MFYINVLLRLIVISCFLVSSAAWAVVPRFVHFDDTDQLPNSTVRTIVQDKYGYIWFGTTKGLARFDGYSIATDFPSEIFTNTVRINSLLADESHLWIGTNGDGLYRYDGKLFKHFPFHTLTENQNTVQKVNAIIKDNNRPEWLWVATAAGVIKYTPKKTILYQPDPENNTDLWANNVSSLRQTSKGIYIGAEKGLYFLPENQQELRKITIDQDLTIFDMLLDGDLLWLGTDKGLFNYNIVSEHISDHGALVDKHMVLSLVKHEHNLWVGTIGGGVYRIQSQNMLVNQYIGRGNDDENGLIDKNIVSLFIDNNDVLWLGSFNDGAIRLDLNSLAFGMENNGFGSVYCSESKVFYSIYEDDNNNLWLGTESGLVKYNPNTKACYSYSHDISDNPVWIVYDIKPVDNIYWLSTSNGLKWLDISADKVYSSKWKTEEKPVYFSALTPQGNLLLGSQSGLYQYNPAQDDAAKVITQPEDLNGSTFYNVKRSEKVPTTYYFSTNMGVVKLDAINLEYTRYDVGFVNDLFVTNDDFVWAGTKDQGLYRINPDGKIEKKLNATIKQDYTVSINSILREGGYLWLGTDLGMIRYHMGTGNYHHFQRSDGLQGNYFLRSAFKSPLGKLYFGGRDGFNAFFPEEIKTNQNPPKVILAELRRFNKIVKPGIEQQGFVINQPIHAIDQLELSHRDYMIGFEWSSANYSDPGRNQYAHRLSGLQEEWIYGNAENRSMTYTNLAPGDYIFQVKAANKDGVWNTKPHEVNLRVKPAPWLSPWAYAIYTILTFISIISFIRYRTAASRKRALVLENTVEKRTHELNSQKKVVESLLEQKSALFANITHEFKTPLTLILGPVNRLLKKNQLDEEQADLSMVQRNANRLLTMVGQILKLSQHNPQSETGKELQLIVPVLQMIQAAFDPVSQEKNIQLSLEISEIERDACVLATPEALEIILGNLLSNAIKYTPAGGSVAVIATQENKSVIFSVIDTGPGIAIDDQNYIFQRFSRLDRDKEVQGTGIGLAVVKELTEMNGGHVELNSVIGNGSSFYVSLPISNKTANTVASQIIVRSIADNVAAELCTVDDEISATEKKNNKATVLVIEDNHDMRQFIGSVLNQEFGCYFADRGAPGVAMALEKIPDIVVCDVMMPGMDGYEVTRRIRNDVKTSHIPIILLTALDTRESRIKGWRENIDVYVTKPFDASELLIRLHNILAIRKLLQSKNFQSYQQGKGLDLPENDRIFIEKLKKEIETHYQDSLFQKAQLASNMAVSERQLLRKTKALIDQNPMDMLREYRLKKACELLIKGYQVNQVSDVSGFGSSSYFIQSFKQKFGMTPKKYQIMKNKIS